MISFIASHRNHAAVLLHATMRGSWLGCCVRLLRTARPALGLRAHARASGLQLWCRAVLERAVCAAVLHAGGRVSERASEHADERTRGHVDERTRKRADARASWWKDELL
jgi:hypothetical protein